MVTTQAVTTLRISSTSRARWGMMAMLAETSRWPAQPTDHFIAACISWGPAPRHRPQHGRPVFRFVFRTVEPS